METEKRNHTTPDMPRTRYSIVDSKNYFKVVSTCKYGSETELHRGTLEECEEFLTVFLKDNELI